MKPNLKRFLEAHAGVYDTTLAELRAGQKQTHWMWFIFPQIQGLGQSETAKFFALESLAEARAYLAHAILGPRLRECSQAMLDNGDRSAFEILGSPDDLKLKSSMTLFEQAACEEPVIFTAVLDRFYDGNRCALTLQFLSAT